ncbi:TonB-dependent receptor domain-containing protein [Teredinibacter haidensis]|uniref:TonB-dependent receptor domain-containing protein n=1 Tax=Teredinibacter haidensis TaxID=2731755 RepID=UPI0009488FFA|nr:TonB-dependent receptor [Teredinibacter haidensis]
MKIRILIAAMSAVAVQALATTDLPIEVVEVIGDNTMTKEQQLDSQSTLSKPVQDAGELLRSVNGVAATRRGGRGFEPIIRGQSQNQLNIMTDGAYTFGACPGRMDPPTAYTAMDNFDQLTIIKGNRSVIYGAGGSGGTLLFEHKRPEFKDKNYLGSIGLGYTSSSESQDGSANLAFGNKRAFGRVFGDVKSSDNYEDADGNVTASSFDSSSYGLIAGSDLNNQHYLQLSFEGVSEDDVWFAGNGMDSPWTDSETARLKWVYSGGTLVDSFELSLYQSNVDHLMDNYSVRNRMPMNENGMAAPSSSDTQGARWLANLQNGKAEWRFGLDHRANDRSAELYMDAGKDGNYNMLASIMWPGVEQQQTGIFAELDYQLNDQDLLRFGSRVDQFDANATRADEPAGMMGSATPNTLYQNAYGVTASDQSDTDLGLVLGWDHKLSSKTVFSTNVSRSVRAADATEQFIARSAMGSSWVGNPDIAAEKHQQLDITVVSRGETQRWSATVFWDKVNDYIERYNLETATLYRNTDAKLYGIEVDGSRHLSDTLSATAALSYTRGESDNGDLGQIAPLEARFNLDYQRDQWAAGAELVATTKQDKVNPVIDAGETDGFTVLNFYSSWEPLKSLRLQAGIENLLDEMYAYHVNAANSDPFNPDPVRVNEPGRRIWLKVRYAF